MESPRQASLAAPCPSSIRLIDQLINDEQVLKVASAAKEAWCSNHEDQGFAHAGEPAAARIEPPYLPIITPPLNSGS